MAQGRGNAAVAGLCLVAVFALLQVSSAKNVVVGGADQKWDYPPGTDVTYYDTWSAKQTLAPGDKLQFQYTAGAHDVQIVSKTEYDACSMASNGKKYLTGNDVIPLAKAGDYYFICSFLGHCDSGMKVSVTVAGAAATPPTPPATPPVTPPATPPASPPPVVIPPPALAPVAPAPVPVLPAPVPAPAPVLPAPVPAPVVVVPVPPAFAPASVPVAGPGSSPPPMTPGVDGPAIAPAPGSSGNALRVGLGMVGTAAVAAAVAGALLL